MAGFSAPKGYSPVVMPRYSPQQQGILTSLLQQLQGGSGSAINHLNLMASGNPQAFEGQEAQAMNFFQNQVAPNIRQQYAHQGMLGSSAFQGSMANAGQQLSQNMYNQRQDLQRQSIMDLLGLTQSLATNPMNEYGVLAKPKKDKFNFGSLISLFGDIMPSLPFFKNDKKEQ